MFLSTLIWSSFAWAKDPELTVDISGMNRVTIRAEVDRSPALTSPILMFQDVGGNILKTIKFKLKGFGVDANTIHPSLLNFKLIYLARDATPTIIAVASSPGGSDTHFETTIIGFINGRIVEFTPSHIDSSSQNALCVEGNKFVLFNFIDKEGHYDSHRYEVIEYKVTNSKLKKINMKQTKKKYESWKGAAAELGYQCGNDLIQAINPNYL